MIHYQRISGVTLEGSASLPTIQRTPEGEAMGAVPGWNVLFDPSYSDSGGVRNRAQPNNTAPVTEGAVQIGDIAGADAFDLVDEMRLGGEFNAPLNPSAVTAFTVVESLRTSPINRHYPFTPIAHQDEQLSPVFAFATVSGQASIVVYEHSLVDNPGAPQRLNHRFDGLLDASPHLVMWTASSETGVSIWVDGQRVAHDANDTRPLEFGTEEGALRSFVSARGKFGMTGLLNIDLSAPENTGHRRAIEKFLMTKYGIPQGAQ